MADILLPSSTGNLCSGDTFYIQQWKFNLLVQIYLPTSPMWLNCYAYEIDFFLPENWQLLG